MVCMPKKQVYMFLSELMFLHMHRNSRWPPDVSIITINYQLHNDETFCASSLAILLKKLLFMPKKINLHLSAESCPKYTDINIWNFISE